jgi:RNA polymerase sigma-70 factor (ECF subfamily)
MTRALRQHAETAQGPGGLTTVDLERVRRVLYLYGLGSHDIDDAVQEVRLRLLERHTAVRSTRSWACAVAVNLALDAKRRDKRKHEAERRLRAVPEATGPPAPPRLDPELRALVVLRYYADLTLPEVAGALALPEGTVKSRLHRALSQLRDTLTEEVSA